jgi:hypothetical protein
MDEFGALTADWGQRRAAARRAMINRMAARPQWVPIGRAAPDRLDVYGGSGRGWSLLLVTLGASLLGAGTRLTVLDLSRQEVAQPLCAVAERHGRTVRVVRPTGAAAPNLLAGLDAREVAEALVDAAHAAAEASPETHSLDLRLLTEVCQVLAPALSVARVCAGLRVLLGSEPGSALTEGEFERLTGLRGQIVRASAEPRLAILEARLHQLGSAPGADDPLVDVGAELCLVEIGEDGGDATAALLGPLALQILLHRARRSPRGGALVVAGADLVPRAQLERVDRIAQRHGVRLVCLFQRLRDDAEQLIGGGGPVVLMRLGNAAEAARAADFIGREHRFVLHQLTLTAGTGTTEGFAESTRDDVHTSLREAAARRRTYELSVEPRELQILPETAVFVVDPVRQRGPRAVLADCNPWLITMTGAPDGAAPSLEG